MRTLIIDPNGSKITDDTTNVHARNSLQIARYLNAELLYDDENQLDLLEEPWDAIVFVHASAYQHTSEMAMKLADTKARLFYITNEYNLGENWALYFLSKNNGIKYEVIANHSRESNTMIFERDAISEWHVVNLNTLQYMENLPAPEPTLYAIPKMPCCYYGVFRKGRESYFKKYFDKRMVVSTSERTVARYLKAGIEATYIGTLSWNGLNDRLDYFYTTLYLEDVHTHKHYNFLANRFYEAVSFNVPLLVDANCASTFQRGLAPYGMSKHDLGIDFVNSRDELWTVAGFYRSSRPFDYGSRAHALIRDDKQATLKAIKAIIER